MLLQAHFQQLMRLGARLFAHAPVRPPTPRDASEGQQTSPGAAAAAAGDPRSGGGRASADPSAPTSTSAPPSTGTAASADFLAFWEGLLLRR